MAFQDVLDKIADDIIDNTDRLITPGVLRSVLNEIAQWAQDDKVDKVAGKGLSEEDFTTAKDNKLAGIESGAEVNEVSASDLNDYLLKSLAIEIEADGVATFFNGDMDTLTDTGIYRGGFLVTNSPPNADSRCYYIVIKNDDNLVTQIAFSFSGNTFSRRTMVGGVFGDWLDYLSASDKTELLYKINSDKTELLGKINKLEIEDIDLSDPAIWTPSTRTLDLSSKEGVGIFNFNTAFTPIAVTNISEDEPAVLSYEGGSGSSILLQNDQLINLSGVQGGSPFTDLNSGDYMIGNIDRNNLTFELHESGGGPVNTQKVTHANITNVTEDSQALFTVDNSDELFNGKLVETSSIGGMGTLDGTIYQVDNLVENEFRLFDPNAGSYVDTTGMQYTGGGTIVSAAYDSELDSSISFKDGLIDINISKITGLSNGKRMKFTASPDNQIEFNKRLLVVATTNDIVGSESLVLEENKVFELLRNKNLNWMKSEFEAS